MYAIIDIETTGGNPKIDRITEIAILIHNGQRVIDQFESLVNPEAHIPPFIESLTGISNAMVSAAPLWEEIADRVNKITQDKIFVAHNVRFDYGFVVNEFKRLGQRYQRRQLDTVRITRAIIPGQPSYSLGKLCANLGIPLHNRHRAGGDCAATADLFSMLIQSDKHSIIQKAIQEELSSSNLPAHIKWDDIDRLPSETGVYYFKDAQHKIIYIGKSKDIKQRVMDHMSGDLHSERYLKLKQSIHHIDFVVTGSELVALLEESIEIKKYMPPFNFAEKWRKYRYGIFAMSDPNGYYQLKLKVPGMGDPPLFMVTKPRYGYAKMLDIVTKANLCLNLCVLDDASAKDLPEQCNCPVCSDNEDRDSYNMRLLNAFAGYTYSPPDFAIIDQGRTLDERSVIYIHQGRFLGFGYIELGNQEYDYHALSECIEHKFDHPDLRRIINQYLNTPKKAKQLIFPN